jgi:hypothetical protein
MYGYYSGVSGGAVAVCGLLGVVAGLALFFTFLAKRNEGAFSGFLGWLYEFLNFKTLLADTILRVLYLISASAVTLVAFAVLLFTRYGTLGGNFLQFLLILAVGNVLVRLLYEFALLTLMICRNTTEINAKLGGSAPGALPYTPPASPAPPVPPPACASCGAPLGAGDAFCPKCGAPK